MWNLELFLCFYSSLLLFNGKMSMTQPPGSSRMLQALYVTRLEAFPSPLDVCPLLPMKGEVVLGNVNVCSHQITL